MYFNMFCYLFVSFELFFSPKMRACAHKALSPVVSSALSLKADACSSFIFREKLVQTTFKYHSVSLITHPVCVKGLVAAGTEIFFPFNDLYTYSFITYCQSPSFKKKKKIIHFEVDK